MNLSEDELSEKAARSFIVEEEYSQAMITFRPGLGNSLILRLQVCLFGSYAATSHRWSKPCG